MSLTVIEQAYAKVNLCLFMGPTRADGRHELVTVFDSVRLADELVVSETAGPADEVMCEGVSGPNLVSNALRELRHAGWAAPPVHVEIWKRIPIAAGMGGGSADAAAMLRCAPRMAPVDSATVQRIAAGLGADVPSQLTPGASLGTGAGEQVTPLGRLATYAVLVLPQRFPLSTPAVYREADRLGVGRSAPELAQLRARVESEIAASAPLAGMDPEDSARGGRADALSVDDLPRGALSEELCVNDLQAAALSLRPELSEALEAARAAGADRALVCGSGPTVIGLYLGSGAGARARAAAHDAALRARFPGAVAASPVDSAQSGHRL